MFYSETFRTTFLQSEVFKKKKNGVFHTINVSHISVLDYQRWSTPHLNYPSLATFASHFMTPLTQISFHAVRDPVGISIKLPDTSKTVGQLGPLGPIWHSVKKNSLLDPLWSLFIRRPMTLANQWMRGKQCSLLQTYLEVMDGSGKSNWM